MKTSHPCNQKILLPKMLRSTYSNAIQAIEPQVAPLYAEVSRQ